MKKCLRREIAKLSVRFMYSLQFKLLETRRKNKGCLGEHLFCRWYWDFSYMETVDEIEILG